MIRPVPVATAAAVALTMALAAALGDAAAAEPTAPPRPAVTEAPAGWPAPPPVEAESWLLVEGASGQVLAGERVDELRPVASTIKILTALTVITRTSVEDEVTVGIEVLDVGGATVGLAPGDTWTVGQLLDGLIARSGNDASEALAVHVAGSRAAFLELLAADARRLGLDDVVLTSPSGLDDGNLLTALDLATIARAALAEPRLRPFLARATVDLPGVGVLESRNLFLTTYPGATGVKTGFTVAAGNSIVASAERAGRELVVVILGAGDDPARFDLAARLLDHGFERYAVTDVAGRLTVAVGGGAVALAVAPAPVTAPAGQPPALAFTVPVRPPARPTAVPVVVAGETVTTLAAELETDGAPAVAAPNGGAGSDAEALGRLLADHAYAALRAATAAGVLR